MTDLAAAIAELQLLRWPTATLLADQLTLLEAAEAAADAGPDDEDPLAEHAAAIARDEAGRLRACLEDLIATAHANRERDAAGGPLLRLTDFGAVGDGVHDDAPAWRAAVAALQAAGPGAILRVSAGRYRLGDHADPAERYHLCWRGLTDVTIDAEPGAVLVGSLVGGVVLAEDCRNLRVRHLAIRIEPAPCTQGRIRSLAPDRSWAEWQPDDGFDGLDTPAFPADRPIRATPRDPVDGGFLGNRGVAVRAEGAGGSWHLRPADEDRLPEDWTPGTTLVCASRGVPGHRCALWLRRCVACDLVEVAVDASYHFAWYLTACTGVSLRRCSAEPGRGSGSLCAINADGFHLKSNRVGPFLEDCRSSATRDDCVNAYCRGASLVDQPDARTLVLDADWDREDDALGEHWGWRPDRRDWRPGDLITTIDPMDAATTAVARIVGIERHDWRGHALVALRLDRALPALSHREGLGRTQRVERSSEFLHVGPDEAVETCVFDLATKSDGLVLRGCSFAAGAVAGIKLKASNALITRCRFTAFGWCAIDLCMRLVWQEGYAPHRVVIRDNDFATRHPISSNCGYPGGRSDIGPAYIHDVRVEGNRFVGAEPWCLRLNNIRNVTIADNRLSGSEPVVVGQAVGRLLGNQAPRAVGASRAR